MVVDDDEITGFATVAAAQIEIDDLPKTRKKKLPRYPLPVLRLARLAVDVSAQGRGVGKLLLRAVTLPLYGRRGRSRCRRVRGNLALPGSPKPS